MNVIRRIHALNGHVSLFNLLSSSYLGKVYKRFLKPYPFVHGFVLWVWTTIIPFALFTYSKYKFGSLPLKKLSQYTNNRQVLVRAQLVKIGLPKIFPKRKIVLNPQSEFEFPEIYIATIINTIITGASNFMKVDESIICHDLFRSDYDYTSEELHSRFLINSKKSCVTLLNKGEVAAVIENGVVFTDAVSGNYVHFLTEVLPKVFLYRKEHGCLNAPLIIDYGLHPNIMQALEMVVGNDIKLIGLETDAHLLVKSLQVVSPCGYIPFQRRLNTKHLTDHSDGLFSPTALGEMSQFIKKSVSQLVPTSIFRKIYIRRNSQIRNISNSEDVEAMLITQGFIVIEPEKLSFIEQVNIFSNSDIIVGATGAAFGNLIFCNAKTKIIILTSDYKNMIYGYWQNMAHAVGNNVTYVIGESVDVQSHLHSNFKINISDIKDAIAS